MPRTLSVFPVIYKDSCISCKEKWLKYKILAHANIGDISHEITIIFKIVSSLLLHRAFSISYQCSSFLLTVTPAFSSLGIEGKQHFTTLKCAFGGTNFMLVIEE